MTGNQNTIFDSIEDMDMQVSNPKETSQREVLYNPQNDVIDIEEISKPKKKPPQRTTNKKAYTYDEDPDNNVKSKIIPSQSIPFNHNQPRRNKIDKQEPLRNVRSS